MQLVSAGTASTDHVPDGENSFELLLSSFYLGALFPRGFL